MKKSDDYGYQKLIGDPVSISSDPPKPPPGAGSIGFVNKNEIELRKLYALERIADDVHKIAELLGGELNEGTMGKASGFFQTSQDRS